MNKLTCLWLVVALLVTLVSNSTLAAPSTSQRRETGFGQQRDIPPPLSNVAPVAGSVPVPTTTLSVIEPSSSSSSILPSQLGSGASKYIPSAASLSSMAQQGAGMAAKYVPGAAQSLASAAQQGAGAAAKYLSDAAQSVSSSTQQGVGMAAKYAPGAAQSLASAAQPGVGTAPKYLPKSLSSAAQQVSQVSQSIPGTEASVGETIMESYPVKPIRETFNSLASRYYDQDNDQIDQIGKSFEGLYDHTFREECKQWITKWKLNEWYIDYAHENILFDACAEWHTEEQQLQSKQQARQRRDGAGQEQVHQLPTSVYGQTELTKLNEPDQKCVSDLYVRLAPVPNYQRDFSESQVKVYEQFLDCISEEALDSVLRVKRIVRSFETYLASIMVDCFATKILSAQQCQSVENLINEYSQYMTKSKGMLNKLMRTYGPLSVDSHSGHNVYV